MRTVRTAHKRSIERTHFQVTILLFVRQQLVVSYGPPLERLPLQGHRMYCTRLPQDTTSDLHWLQPLSRALSVTISSSFRVFCGQSSPSDAVVCGDVATSLPHFFRLQGSCSAGIRERSTLWHGLHFHYPTCDWCVWCHLILSARMPHNPGQTLQCYSSLGNRFAALPMLPPPPPGGPPRPCEQYGTCRAMSGLAHTHCHCTTDRFVSAPGIVDI